MNRRRFIKDVSSGVLAAATLSGGDELLRAVSAPQAIAEFNWPAITAQCRPWTYWWWMGSAVDEQRISDLLNEYRQAGLGGVHIIPIYSAHGVEARNIRFLSTRWMKALAHTCEAAKSLGMGVDLTTGTGWPFGGPWVTETNAAPLLLMESYQMTAGGELLSPVRHAKQLNAKLATLMAYSAAGEILDLTARVNAAHRLEWIAPAGEWTLYAIFEGRTDQQVKRAAPGGEGRVIDHFNSAALKNYLAHFDAAFAGKQINLRAMYNDSYEVYGSNWTQDLFDEFIMRRGYDLREHLPEFDGHGDPDRIVRVRCDYRATIADLVLERFTLPWVEWSHRQGFIARNEAHGAPANILDLYAAADVPETESFGPSRFPIPGLRVEPNLPAHFGKPDVLVMKFASSAAHLRGRKLISSETCTWLAEHFQVSLSQIKPEIDQLFVGGVNHVFFHGTTYSPADAPWPGWLFYASTNFGPSSSFWNELPELNAYITRCQSVLQSGLPDNDLLVYFPIYNLWQSPSAENERATRDENKLRYLTAHNSDDWMNGSELNSCARALFNKGYSFDYISDRLLMEIKTSGGELLSGTAKYRALLVPNCRLMPLETFQKLKDLAAGGATVIFKNDLPPDVPGLGALEERRQKLAAATKTLRREIVQGELSELKINRGRFLIGIDDERMLSLAKVSREAMTTSGLSFVRRAHRHGHLYFITNLGAAAFDGWAPLGTAAETVVILDALNNRRGIAATRIGTGLEVYLQLAPGESRVLRTFTTRRINGSRWKYSKSAGESVPLDGSWEIEFLSGGPVLPAKINTSALQSWTELGGADAKSFSGTARYTMSFQLPARAAFDDWLLDLGIVCESARVRLNNREAGVAWSLPFRLAIGGLLRSGSNKLEIEVTNLNANRIAEMARRQQDWIKFYFVNIQYQSFDAARWPPMPSGLIGPVKLVPQKSFQPVS